MLHKIVYIIKTHIFANQNIMVVFYVMFDISSIHAKSRTNPHNNNKHLNRDLCGAESVLFLHCWLSKKHWKLVKSVAVLFSNIMHLHIRDRHAIPRIFNEIKTEVFSISRFLLKCLTKKLS